MTDTKLCQQLAEAVGAGKSPLIPKLFEMLVNDDEAKVLLVAAPPATIEEIAQKTGLPADKITAMMEPLFKRGLIFKATRGGDKKFYRVKSIPQMHDSTSLTPGMSRDILSIWKEYMEKEWPEYGQKVMDLVPGSIMRVIPVNEGINRNHAFSPMMSGEDNRNAQTLAVTNCSCRVIDGTCGKPLEVCMQVDRAAEYGIERGTGRRSPSSRNQPDSRAR